MTDGGASFAKDGHGLSRNQRWLFGKMAQHPDVVERVIAESTDDDPATRAKVMRAIAEAEGRAGEPGKCVCPDCGALHRRRST